MVTISSPLCFKELAVKTLIMSDLMTNEEKISYPCGSEYKVSRTQIDDDIVNISINGLMAQDVHLSVPYREEYISLCFVLSGKVTSLNQDGSVNSVCSAGEGGLVFHRSFSGSTILHKTDRLSVFSIVMPYNFLRKTFKCSLPEQVSRLLVCQAKEQFCRHEVLFTPQIKSILHQIEQAQPSEALKYFFVASKTYELINYCFEQFSGNSCDDSSLSKNDVGCLKQARKILSENIAEPPSIIQLSRMVGINDCKLKRGFKQLFSTTPFGYVQELRMMHAKHSLLNGGVSVATVANQVGYTNVGHFAAAFRKQYGTTPRDFKKAAIQMMAQS